MSNKQADFKIDKPKFVRDIAENHITVSYIKDEDSFSDGCVRDCSIPNCAAYHVCFERISFSNVVFSSAALKLAEFTDVCFENCDFSNADLSGAIIHRTEFINCKLVGFNLSDATLQNVSMQGCNGKFALLSYTRLKRVVFKDSILDNSNLQNSSLDKVKFLECSLCLSQVSGTGLSGIDLCSCNTEGMGVQPENLKGAIVSPVQAVQFSRLLGLVVKE